MHQKKLIYISIFVLHHFDFSLSCCSDFMICILHLFPFMKKLLVLFLFVSHWGFSQQVLMKKNANQFIFICLANGNSLTQLCGNSNFSTNYNNYYIAIEYQTITMSSSPSTPVNITNETINSTNFNWSNPGIQYTSTAITNPYPLSFIIKSVWSDCNNDGNKDILYISIDFPINQTNGSSIPVGTKIIFNSPILNNYISETPLLDSIQRWYEWDGIQWNQYNYNAVSYPLINENWESNHLSNLDFDKESDVTMLIPNPSNQSITIQSEKNSTEIFNYKILDLTGRIVKNGYSKFNEKISVEALNSGNFIIQIETKNGKKTIEKLIKN